MLMLLLVTTFVTWFLHFRYKRRNLYRLAAKIPALEGFLPGIGIAHKFFGDTQSIMETLKQFSYNSMKHDGLVKGWLCHLLYFVLIDPADVEYVMKTCLEKDDLHKFPRKVTGYGGIFAPVAIWRRRRKILVPIFSPKIVENYADVFAAHSQKLVKKLSESVGEDKIKLWPFLSSYTLDSVCETTMGVEINAQDDPYSNQFLLALNKTLNLVSQRIFQLWLQPDWLYSFFPQYKEHERSIGLLHNYTDKVIRMKRDEIKKEKELKTEVGHEIDLGLYKTKTFLDLLIKTSGGDKGYTNEELKEETLTLTIAGTDTSGVATGFTFLLLAKYPDVQEKVYQEIYSVCGDSDRNLVKEDLVKFKYLERVIKESLRLFPPVPLVIRKVLKDITLPSGRVLPAGSGVACSIWGVHRDPKYWGSNAEEFDPDRFLPERFNLKHACSYMPFSSGPRNCVGYQYGMMSMKTVIATVLRRYCVLVDGKPGAVSDIKVKIDIMLKAVDNYEVTLKEREKKCQYVK